MDVLRKTIIDNDRHKFVKGNTPTHTHTQRERERERESARARERESESDRKTALSRTNERNNLVGC